MSALSMSPVLALCMYGILYVSLYLHPCLFLYMHLDCSECWQTIKRMLDMIEARRGSVISGAASAGDGAGDTATREQMAAALGRLLDALNKLAGAVKKVRHVVCFGVWLWL